MAKDDANFKSSEESCFKKHCWNGCKKWVFMAQIVAIVVVVVLLCTSGKTTEEEDTDGNFDTNVDVETLPTTSMDSTAALLAIKSAANFSYDNTWGN
jgi:hypothetical protein